MNIELCVFEGQWAAMLDGDLMSIKDLIAAHVVMYRDETLHLANPYCDTKRPHQPDPNP